MIATVCGAGGRVVRPGAGAAGPEGLAPGHPASRRPCQVLQNPRPGT